MTHLPNRHSLEKALETALAELEPDSGKLGLLVLDLDRFKQINDGFGFDTGNILLIDIAARLLTIVDKSGYVFRLGGDEFAVLMPGKAITETAQMADTILQQISQPFVARGQEVSFTTSIGIAHFPMDGETAALLMQKADSALSRAKAAGRNNAQFFDESTQRQSVQLIRLESALRKAIGSEELVLYYQPQFLAATNELCGFEALIRWQHPDWGMVAPATFIPVAEQTGQIIALGRWIIRQALQQISEWQQAGILKVPVAINISGVQFRQDELYNDIADALHTCKVEPKWLCVEITESIAMMGTEQGLKTIERLHDLGVCIAIDDFGSGYSSLSYLKELKVDKLKIDQSFVRDLTDDPFDKAIVQSIIDVAHSLGLKTVAEGVETAAQLDRLREMNCDEVQGFYFSQALPPEQLTDWLTKS